MIWTPHVTVAAVIADNDRYLLVEEDVGQAETVFNQPAGHLEANESLIDAAIRETLEETGYTFTPEAITGVYRWIEPVSDNTYLRVCFNGHATPPAQPPTLDSGIVTTHWLSLDEVNALTPRLRSPLVRRSIEDHIGGGRYPLALLQDI